MNSITDFDFHADDYGLSEHSDNDIINLCITGKLNSISIMPNMCRFENSVQLYQNKKRNFPNKLFIAIGHHLLRHQGADSPQGA